MELNKDMVNPRTGIGALIGAGVGFVFGGPLGAGIGGLVGAGVAHASGDAPKGVMTPKRQLIFTKAMESMKEPEELCKLADAYEGEGLRTQATALRKRAELRKLPLEVKDKRRIAFRKSMACDDPDVILTIAKAFQVEGALDASKALLEHADAVRGAHAAGKTAKPMMGGSIAQFADKLGKALVHFGPESPQAKTAAKNLIQARGKQPVDALVTEVIRIATEALQIETPAATAPAELIEIETPGEAPPDEEPPAAGPVDAEAPASDEGAVAGEEDPAVDEDVIDVKGVPTAAPAEEGTVVGPPAKKIEPVVVQDGAPIAGEAAGSAGAVA